MFNKKNIEDEINLEDLGDINDLSNDGKNDLENINKTKSNSIGLDGKNKFITQIKDFKNSLVEKIDEFIEKKGYTERKELIVYEIRDNLILLIILFLTLSLGLLFVFNTSDFIKDYEGNLKKLNSLKIETQTIQKKIEGNKSFQEFSDLLQYGVEKDGKYYPEKGYLVELNHLYPTKEDLKFGTFTEGWTSDFKDWRGEKIRIPKDILKEYKIIGEEDINETTKEIKYGLKLEGPEHEVNEYLSLLSGLKLITNIPEITETQNNGISSTEVTISFLLSK